MVRVIYVLLLLQPKDENGVAGYRLPTVRRRDPLIIRTYVRKNKKFKFNANTCKCEFVGRVRGRGLGKGNIKEKKNKHAINYEWHAKLRKCHPEPGTYDE
jgi:hypothetical protein